jgi:hypothetical protein
MNRYQIERGFARIVRNGDLSAIANARGHSLSYVSQQFSPETDRESDLFKAIDIFRAWIGNDHARGSRALALFNHFASTDTAEPLCIQKESLKLKTEVDDWETASMCGKPLEVIESEILDIYWQSGQALRATARARNQGIGGGKS